LILTAGLGKRLRPLSLVRAKPAVPLAGQPLVSRILRWAARHEVCQLVLNLHHLPETITSEVGDGSGLGVRVRYSWESPVLGSAGGPRKALSLLGDEPFFIINGDTLSSVDLTALADHHRQSGALVTLAVVRHRWPGRYGGVVIDSGGRVHGFVPAGSPAVAYHFVGAQIASPSAFANLPLNEPAESVAGVYRSLIADRLGSIRAFLCDADFVDVGTPADYLDASLAISRAEGFASPPTGRRSRIDASARLVDTVLWDAVEVGPEASLERCVVADGVKIPAGAVFRNQAIVQIDGELVVSEITDG
jgi:NDP-sugar pyrophosphorylase family protein